MPSKNSEQATILLVDDIPDNLKALIDFLEQSGFRIIVAQSGETAIQRAQQALPDLILLDVLMPQMDGFETCQRLKAQESLREIPVIFLTGISDLIEKIKGFEVGGVDYITKPVDYQEVLARINAHLAMRRLQQQLEEQSERFRTLSEATFEGILMHDQGKILEINQTMEQMFGYQRTEVLGRHVLEFVTPESRMIVAENLRLAEDGPYEAAGVRRDGSSFPVEFHGRTMPYHGRNIRIVAMRDLSRHKQLEAEKALLQEENVSLRSSLGERYKLGGMIGKSQAMQTVYQAIVNAAASEANVVICGESGSGKELAARTIHELSARKKEHFVAVNCGAIPENLFEREFFGHRRGTFTSATMDQPGYLAQAHKGTLFLDEIGELPAFLQVKLLRALQEHEYTPLGDTHSQKADIRIIAAANKDLKLLLQEGVIREDFYWRIRVIVIELPPLRNRKDDIPLLIEYFLEQYDKETPYASLPGHIHNMLCTYNWPGNVRELQNELQRYLAHQKLEFIGNTQLDAPLTRPLFPLNTTAKLHEVLEICEKDYILSTLQRNHGHRGKTAQTLGLPRRTLNRKMQKYGIS
ncbi:sigma-54 interaction domain-containing protein [Candidatus Vecturithrix granuli]|uniref:Sigma-54 interaction domain-containing protein n=1 Tax=Vecturithrix granuli TaxID=1499967 RepID=A0A081BUB8_VECG1|nr:sigma-54 interaction domain-containing protein [Candidatus Vecturithrix granuli]